jgi:phosphoribosylanthranilate isomerase
MGMTGKAGRKNAVARLKQRLGHGLPLKWSCCKAMKQQADWMLGRLKLQNRSTLISPNRQNIFARSSGVEQGGGHVSVASHAIECE